MKSRLLQRKIRISKSAKLFLRAQSIIPSGINKLIDNSKSSGGRNAVFIKRASSAFVWDENRNKYTDYVGSHGSMILGHANPAVIKAIRNAVKSGTSFGAPAEIEIQLAELIAKLIPSIEMVRIVNSITEAITGAVHIACAFTEKNKIIKFKGYHNGIEDSFFMSESDNSMTQRIINCMSAGYNNLDSVRALFAENKNQIAAVIVEPIAVSMGCILPDDDFLRGLRAICDEHNALLIFDEVTTGFRVSLSGAQSIYNVRPDLTVLGKILGGGLSIGAYGGKKEVMETATSSALSKEGRIYSDNPLALKAGFTVLRILQANKMIYKQLEKRSLFLEEGIKENLKKLGLGYKFNRVGSICTLFFTSQKVSDYESAKSADINKYAKYFNLMLEQRIYVPPTQFEAAFVSTAHTERMIEQSIKASYNALQNI